MSRAYMMLYEDVIYFNANMQQRHDREETLKIWTNFCLIIENSNKY